MKIQLQFMSMPTCMADIEEVPMENENGVLNNQEPARTFDDIIAYMLEDPNWEIPKEMRAIFLNGIEWTLNDL